MIEIDSNTPILPPNYLLCGFCVLSGGSLCITEYESVHNRKPRFKTHNDVEKTHTDGGGINELAVPFFSRSRCLSQWGVSDHPARAKSTAIGDKRTAIGLSARKALVKRWLSAD